MVGLQAFGLKITQQLPLKIKSNPHNQRYLETKKTRMGHLL
jgi:3,4-dihydroxy 2-butanone 4-phosphate synthase/GTP cyclohydrolase II